MEKKNIDWSSIGFGYIPTDKRYVSQIIKTAHGMRDVLTYRSRIVTMSECAGVLQYAQTCFEGMKAYTTEDGHIVIVPPGPERRAYGELLQETGDAGIPGRNVS